MTRAARSIAYVLPGRDLVPGDGYTRRLLGLARALAAHAEVTVVFHRVRAPFVGEPFEVRALEPGPAAQSAPEVVPSRRSVGRFVEEHGARFGVVLEGSWASPGRLTAWCAQRGIPAIPVIDRLPSAGWLAPLDAGPAWLGLAASGRYLRRAPVVIAGSEALRQAMVGRWRVDQGRIAVIGPGVDRARLFPADQAAARRTLGLSPEHRILVAGGALDRRHDLTPLIEAVLRAGDPALRLHVLGAGERRAGLERVAAADPAVRFHGRVPDGLVATWIAAADLCVAVEDPTGPLYEDGVETTFAVRECQAAGRPVAVGSVGGAGRPFLRHGVTGFLVEHDLVDWIRFLQRDCPSRNVLRDMGQAAAALPVEGLDRTAAAYLEAIERAVRAGAAPAVR